MLGNLSLSSIPYHNPIIMGAVGFSILVGLIIVGTITYYGKWGYLYKEWFCSVDHKRIGVMYIVLAMIMLLRGFADAIMMRAQQAIAVGSNPGYLPPEHFDQIFSAHGTIMIFFVAMPFMIGLLNIAVPLQIGARDVAFPFLNSVSFWTAAISAILIMISLGIGEFSQAGWTGYPPLSELPNDPGTGVDYWIWAIQISGIGSLMTGINFMVTILKLRAPGMTLMKMPVFTWTALCASALIVLSFPMLTVTLALLTMDRYLGMHFFTAGHGGNLMMYTNLFWTWGHPEVYLLMVPAFGVFSEVVPTFSGKRLYGYTSMVWATIAIALLSFVVWLHHFFTMGASANVNAFFGITTMIIAVPTGIKLFNWIFTMFRGRVQFHSAMYWTLGFIIAFTVGGMTGVLLSIPGADYQLHNTELLVAHFHNMLIPGAVFGYFAGYTYWFPKAFGFKLNERWGKRAFWGWMIGFLLAFMPLYALGLMGMPRRMDHYANPAWHPYLVVAFIGAVFILGGVIAQIIQLVVSIRERNENRDLTGDPWNGRTLEWATSSPPPYFNFARLPAVHQLDEFCHMKSAGTAYQPADKFFDIHMPKNTPAGFFIGMLCFAFGFAMIWHIWWLALASVFGVITTVIIRGSEDEPEYVVPASELESSQARRLKQVATVEPTASSCNDDGDDSEGAYTAA
ncbi:MAG: cytochrome o ubiquinol oxidase subunit I [Gammaproteobacteria bacterium]|jgi:cytochrome o ubiquinol oxidase subunit I